MSVVASVRALPRTAILRAADSDRLQRFVQTHGMRLGAGRFVAGVTLDDCVAVLRALNDQGLHANTTLLGEAVPDEARGGGDPSLRGDPRPAGRGAAGRERRAQADAPRPRARRGARLRQRRAARRACGAPRHVRPDRHGAVGARRGHAAHLRAAPGGRAWRRSARCCSRTCTAREATSTGCCRSSRTSASSRAPTWSRRRSPSRTRPTWTPLRRLVERMMRGGAYVGVATHDEAIIEQVTAFARAARDRARPVRAPDALRRPPGAPEAPGNERVQGSGCDPVRARLVPVPDAPPRGASGERRLLRPQRDPAMTELPGGAGASSSSAAG